MKPFTTPHLDGIDLVLIVVYLVINAFIGFISFKKKRAVRSNAEEFILAGRSLTLPAFVATLVTMWYGGVLGVGEYAYDKGIVMWTVFGIPYYVAALICAFFLAHRINSDRANSTLSDRLRNTYGPATGYLGSIVAFFMTSPAGFIMTLGTLYQWFFGIDTKWGMAIAFITPISYLLLGGLRAPVGADRLRFVLMFFGFGIILPFAYLTFGGLSFITMHVPAGHLKVGGGLSPWYIAVWYIMALSTLVDPNVNTRVFAAHTPRIAKRGLIISVGCWLVFDFMTNIAGLYARAAFATLPASRFAFPALAERVLPHGFLGLFYIGMLATELSAVDAFTFTSATILGRDVLWRLIGKGEDAKVKLFTRIGLLLTLGISAIVIALSDRIYTIWYAFGSVLVPALLFPLTLSYFPRLRPSSRGAFVSMLLGGVSSLTAYLIGVTRGNSVTPIYLFGCEPMYVGLAFALVVILVDRAFRAKTGIDRDSLIEPDKI